MAAHSTEQAVLRRQVLRRGAAAWEPRERVFHPGEGPAFALSERVHQSKQMPVFDLRKRIYHPAERPTDAPFQRGSPTKHVTKGKGKAKVRAAFEEVHENEPGIVAHTRKKFGAERAEKQRTAIALDKARRAGAKIPRRGGR